MIVIRHKNYKGGEQLVDMLQIQLRGASVLIV